jgi:hypothetical protein
MNDYLLGLMTGGIMLLALEIAWWSCVAVWLPRVFKKWFEEDDV